MKLCLSRLSLFFLLLFVQYSRSYAQEPKTEAAFMSGFLSPDTSRTEYAGLYGHYVSGGFSSRRQNYPQAPSGTLTPLSSSVRSFAFGAASDSPIRLPFLTKRQNNEFFKGFHFGMQVEAQLSDISITETSLNPMLRLHNAFISLRSLAIIPSLRYVSASGFTLQTGVRLGIINSSFLRISDSIVQTPTLPNSNIPADESFSSPITGLQVGELSLMTGLGYNIRIDKTVQLRPEIVVNIPLQSVQETATWKLATPTVRFGMNILFNTAKVIPVPDTIYQRDTTLIMVQYTQKPLLTLLSRITNVRPAEYPEEPPIITITESYRRDIPKPKPLLTASIDAEFSLGNQQFRRSVTVQAEKTAFTLTPICTNTTNASIYADVLNSYFAEQGMQLRTIQTSTNTIVSDTTVLVSTLPKIRFTPRVVSENPLLGTRLQIFRQHIQTNTKNHAVRQLLVTFIDSGETVPVVWNPAQMPDLLMNPNERLFYIFSVIDENSMEIPADSGAINLRTEAIVGNLGLKRSVDVYAFEAELPLADFMRTLVAINIANTERVGIVAPSDTSNASANSSEMALRLQLLHRTLPKAERVYLTFNKSVEYSSNLASEANILPTASDERTKKMREILSRMMLVFVERRL
jgi:hypothetical protein